MNDDLKNDLVLARAELAEGIANSCDFGNATFSQMYRAAVDLHGLLQPEDGENPQMLTEKGKAEYAVNVTFLHDQLRKIVETYGDLMHDLGTLSVSSELLGDNEPDSRHGGGPLTLLTGGELADFGGEEKE